MCYGPTTDPGGFTWTCPHLKPKACLLELYNVGLVPPHLLSCCFAENQNLFRLKSVLAQNLFELLKLSNLIPKSDNVDYIFDDKSSMMLLVLLILSQSKFCIGSIDKMLSAEAVVALIALLISCVYPLVAAWHRLRDKDALNVNTTPSKKFITTWMTLNPGTASRPPLLPCHAVLPANNTSSLNITPPSFSSSNQGVMELLVAVVGSSSCSFIQM